MPDHDHDHDHGLAADLACLARQAAGRRRMLHWLGSSGAALALAACGARSDAATGTTGAGSTDASGNARNPGNSARCALIPEETAGPFPGDGSNRGGGSVANALLLSGIVRSDIRSSLAGAGGVAGGVPLTVGLRLLDAGAACTALAGYAVYVWHCDREGRYSMYSAGVTGENYLRGVQASGADGTARFVTSFPGCYGGRMPHIHFAVYRSLSSATRSSSPLRTSQLALPPAACQAAYASSGYAASLANLARTSFASDGVFSDGVALQMATVAGDVHQGFVASLDVAINA